MLTVLWSLVYVLLSNYLGFISSSSPVPDPPLIDLSNSKVYNEASICWRLSDDHLPTDHHVLEYRRWVQTYKEITPREETHRQAIGIWTNLYHNIVFLQTRRPEPVPIPGGRWRQRGLEGYRQGLRSQHCGVWPGPEQPVCLQSPKLQELHVQPLQPWGHLPHTTCTW